MIYFSIIRVILTTDDIILKILGIILIIVIIIYFVSKIRRTTKLLNKNKNFWMSVFIAIGKTVEEKFEEEKKTKLLSLEERKRELFKQGGLKTFYFLDHGQIDDLYLQIFNNIELTRIETNSVNSSETELGVNALESLKSKSTSKFNNELKAIYEKGKDTPSTKYILVENYFANNSQLQFGLEDIPESEIEQKIEAFKKQCSELINNFSYEITEQQQSEHIKEIMRKKALKAIKRLSKAIGYFSLKLNVKVEEINNDFSILSYEHPINQYLGNDDKKIQLKLKCPRKYFSDNGLSSMTTGKLFNITTLAKISSWDEETNTIELSPIAIY